MDKFTIVFLPYKPLIEAVCVCMFWRKVLSCKCFCRILFPFVIGISISVEQHMVLLESVSCFDVKTMITDKIATLLYM